MFHLLLQHVAHLGYAVHVIDDGGKLILAATDTRSGERFVVKADSWNDYAAACALCEAVGINLMDG